MTTEHRLIAGLSDIRAMTLECKSCMTRLTMYPENAQAFRAAALDRSCGYTWLPDEALRQPNSTLPQAALVAALKTIRTFPQEQERLGFKLLLEFDDNRGAPSQSPDR